MTKSEAMHTLDMPMPHEPEDIDWACSPLFKFVKDDWLKHLVHKNKIYLDQGEYRPQTPES